MRDYLGRGLHVQRHAVEVPEYRPAEPSPAQKAATARTLAGNIERLFAEIDRSLNNVRLAAQSGQHTGWATAHRQLDALMSDLDRFMVHAAGAIAAADADTAIALRDAPHRRAAVRRAVAALPGQPERPIPTLPGEDRVLLASAHTRTMGSTAARYAAIESALSSWIAGLTTAQSRVLEERLQASEQQRDDRDPLVRQLQRMTPQRRGRLLDYARDPKRRARADMLAARAGAPAADAADAATAAADASDEESAADSVANAAVARASALTAASAVATPATATSTAAFGKTAAATAAAQSSASAPRDTLAVTAQGVAPPGLVRPDGANSAPGAHEAASLKNAPRGSWALQCQSSKSASSKSASSTLALAPTGHTSPLQSLDSVEARIVALIDGATDNSAERAILDLLIGLDPAAYSQLIERLRTRKDGPATYLERLYADLHGEEFQHWLSLDRAKRIAARAGRPETLATTMASLERGQGIESFDYAPSQLTAPSTWDYRSYPHRASYDQHGHVRLLWRTHNSWHQVSGTATGHRLPPDALIRVHNRVTGKTDVLTAAQAKALADQHETDANLAKVTVIGMVAGAALIGTSRTLLGKVGTVLFEVVLPAVGQYVAEHQHEIGQMQGGREFLRAWQIFNLAMAGFGIFRLAWGPGRAVANRVRGSADDLVRHNPGSTIAEETAAQVATLDGALDEVRGAARLVAAGTGDDQAMRLLTALGDAGMGAGRVAGLSDHAVRALSNADRALAKGRVQQALRHLDDAELSASEQAAVKKSLTTAHGGLMTDAVTPDGTPAPTLSDRIPEHKVSRASGGFSGGAKAKHKVRARRRALEAKHGKEYVNKLSDSEIYAENLYRGDRRVKEVTLGEPKAAERLGMEYKVMGDERPMVDIVVEDKHGRLVPTEVKNQTDPHFGGIRNAAGTKFTEIATNAQREIVERIDRFEILVHRDSVMPANFKAAADGKLWRLVDGSTSPQVWEPVAYGGKPVVVRRGDLGKISR